MTVTLPQALLIVLIFISILLFLDKLYSKFYIRKTYRTNFKNLLKKQICPRCNIKMNKKIKKRILSSNENSKLKYKSKTYEIAPEFFCSNCNYKIDAIFFIK